MATYDEVLYGDLTFFHTHPCHLAAVAAVCGLEQPPVEECRVLEIGCGTGFNMIAMSQSLPKGRFVGIDLSERQIARGRSIAYTLSLNDGFNSRAWVNASAAS